MDRRPRCADQRSGRRTTPLTPSTARPPTAEAVPRSEETALHWQAPKAGPALPGSDRPRGPRNAPGWTNLFAVGPTTETETHQAGPASSQSDRLRNRHTGWTNLVAVGPTTERKRTRLGQPLRSRTDGSGANGNNKTRAAQARRTAEAEAPPRAAASARARPARRHQAQHARRRRRQSQVRRDSAALTERSGRSQRHGAQPHVAAAPPSAHPARRHQAQHARRRRRQCRDQKRQRCIGRHPRLAERQPNKTSL
jgi:hypothetical protein